MRTILYTILFSLLSTACYDRHRAPETGSTELTAHTTISELYPMCSVGALEIVKSLKIKARVVSDDSSRYINGELYIDDGTATAKLLINQYALYTQYPEGVEISVDLNGLAIAQDDHILQIGLPSTSSKNTVDNIVSQVTIDKHITAGNSINTLYPKEYIIPELSVALCGKIATIHQLTFTPTDPTESHYAGGYHRFCDRESNSIHIYIDQNSTGAGRILPQEEVSLTGIITCKTDNLRDSTTLIIIPRKDSDIWQ